MVVLEVEEVVVLEVEEVVEEVEVVVEEVEVVVGLNLRHLRSLRNFRGQNHLVPLDNSRYHLLHLLDLLECGNQLRDQGIAFSVVFFSAN